jgi:hypothetical protein
MKATWKIAILGVVYGYFAACSPVKFDKAPEPPCGAEGVACVAKCEGENCFKLYSSEKVVGKQPVDVLIVNDNSGSMSTEQKKMGNAFGTFLSSLGAVDYRIAMVTTDISTAHSQTPLGVQNYPGPYNGNGALQDGNLIDFGGGVKYLTDSTPNKESLFTNTISRAETLHCEQSNYKECPSNDERGIFAAYLAIERNEFLRPASHLAIIFLADEDERGMSDTRSAQDQNDRALISMYPLEEKDKPENLISRFRKLYPGKTLSAHSIIVKPGDAACKQAQSSQGTFVRGTEGYSYARMTQMAGGKLGSICENFYDYQLEDIGKDIQSKSLTLPFVCRPLKDEYEVIYNPQLPASANVSATPDWTRMELQVTGNVPVMTRITLNYKCAK